MLPMGRGGLSQQLGHAFTRLCEALLADPAGVMTYRRVQDFNAIESSDLKVNSSSPTSLRQRPTPS